MWSNWPLHTPAQNHKTSLLVTRNAEIRVMTPALMSHFPTVANLAQEVKGKTTPKARQGKAVRADQTAQESGSPELLLLLKRGRIH